MNNDNDSAKQDEKDDIREQLINSEALTLGVISLILVMLVLLVIDFINDKTSNMPIYVIAISTPMAVQYIYKFIKMKDKISLVFAIVFTLCFILAILVMTKVIV